jgi:hypothetical protein
MLSKLLFVFVGAVWGTASPTTVSPTTPSPTAPTPGILDHNPFVMASFKHPEDATDQDILIKGGIATPGQAMWVETDWSNTIFFWLLPTATMDTQPFSVDVASKDFRNFRKIDKYFPMDKQTEKNVSMVQIQYIGCKDVAENKTFHMTADVKLTGFPDVNLAWGFQCSNHNKPSLIPDDGWSPFGTFCFVVFILTLVFCVAGCGYNYISRGRSGTDIIPCWNYIERYLCCKHEKRYSPQMDYDQPIGDDDSYGASYQADL